MSNKNEFINYSDLSQKYKELIYFLNYSKPSHMSIIIKNQYPNLYNIIINNTSKLNNVKFTERLYFFTSELNSKPLCHNCQKKDVSFINFKKGYKKYCSSKCANSDKDYLEKKKQTCLEKYGETTNLKTKETKDKIKRTSLEKYGVEHHSSSNQIKEKKKETLLSNYGVDNPFKSKKIKEKIKKTNEIKYGVENPSQSDKIKKKKRETTLLNYGVDNPLKSNEIKNKIKNTNKERYGVENPSQCEYIKEKIKKTNKIKYGNEIATKSDIVKNRIKETNKERYGVNSKKQEKIENFDKYNDKVFIENMFIKNGELYFNDLIKFFNISETTGYKLINNLNIDFIKIKSTKRLKSQNSILNYIKRIIKNKQSDLNYKIYFNNKKILNSKELDIYIEIYKKNKLLKKIAIEYNGLMFHSFGISKYSMFNNYSNESKDKFKHIIKTELCEEKNIKLFHIFENEWLDNHKQKIWKSMIKNELLLNEIKIYARKCVVKEISNEESIQFLNENHIQGYNVALKKYGLFYKNELISIMTFGKARFNKNYEWELIRFATKQNFNIVGGGSKLLSHFIKKEKPKSLISYGNRRWTSSFNNFYKTNNFILKNNSKINYYYFKNINKLYNRITFQKIKLKNYFVENKYEINIFNEEVSSDFNMYLNGYRKIYDSGQLVYTLEFNN